MSASERIQKVIDNYSSAGANLLNWLSSEDIEQMPKTKTLLFGLIRIKPSEVEWRDWANDVACAASFRTLRETKSLFEE